MNFDDFRKLNLKFQPLSKPGLLSKGDTENLLAFMGGPDGSLETNLNERIPAGFTYLGQFITHDMITAERTETKFPTLRLRALYGNGPDEEEFYVHEESDIPYWVNLRKSNFKGDTLSVFKNVLFRMRYAEPNVSDMQRASIRTDKYDPVIAEKRNDRNYILSQLHCVFMQFHNAVAVWLHEHDQNLTGKNLLEATQRLVIWHYQWIIVNQFLPLLVGDTLVNQVMAGGFEFYDHTKSPVLMPEFSRAAFRIGHSQVREVYIFPKEEIPPVVNDQFKFPNLLRYTRRMRLFLNQNDEVIRKATLQRIAESISKDFNTYSMIEGVKITPQDALNRLKLELENNPGLSIADLDKFLEESLLPLIAESNDIESLKQRVHTKVQNKEANTNNALKAEGLVDMRGSVKRTQEDLFMEWAFFFDYQVKPYAARNYPPQASLAIDHLIAPPLFHLFFLSSRNSLPERDLEASHGNSKDRLPKGSELFNALNQVNALPANTPVLDDVLIKQHIPNMPIKLDKAPLWLYILLEAEILHKGQQLGPVGGRIIAEQILWVLMQDKQQSYLNLQPEWWPEAAFLHKNNKDPKNFGIVDLIEFSKSYLS